MVLPSVVVAACVIVVVIVIVIIIVITVNISSFYFLQSSNIPVNEDCVKCFNDMKLKKKYSYVIMSVKDNKEVVIEEIGEPFPNDCTQRENEEVFNRLREKFLDDEKEPKYLLFDFRLETSDGRREKIAFINW